MKARLTLTLALLLLGSGAALAQTPDGQSPAEETVCDNETGAAFGLCNAYCEAMDCESDSPQASATACTKVRTKFQNITGHDLPCEAPACPCAADPVWNAALAGEFVECGLAEGGRARVLSTTAGIVSGYMDNAQSVGACLAQTSSGGDLLLLLTLEQGAACFDLVDSLCPPER